MLNQKLNRLVNFGADENDALLYSLDNVFLTPNQPRHQ